VDRERRQRQEALHHEDLRSNSGARTNWIKLAYLGAIDALGERRFLPDNDAAVALCERHLAGNLQGSAEVPDLPVIRAPVMRGLDRSMLRRLRGFYTQVAYAGGAMVFSQRALPDGVFLIASGRVEVLIDIPRTERKRKVQTLAAGSVFGEMALIDPKPRSASVIAVEPTNCYWMSMENFERLKLEQPDIAFKLIADVAMIFAERLRATNTMLAEIEA
jgi:CRP-like cAMP-binding protein